MAKSSKRRPARQNKDHAGCMWGLMSIFDFRHGRTTRRLLSDRRRYMATNDVGSTDPSPEVSSLTYSKETHPSGKHGKTREKPAFDLIQTSVKELIEEEMCTEHGPRKQNDTNKIVSLSSEFSSRVTSHKHPGKASKRSFDHEISINHRDLEALMKEILLIHQKRNGPHGDVDTGAKQSFPIVQEKLVAAIEVLMKEKSTNEDHDKIHHPREMFQMLSSNKEMFLKLLHDQDQDSLLVDNDQISKSKSMAGSKLSENEPVDRAPEEPVSRKHRKFFRKRSKSHESIPFDEKGRIVILKPGSPDNVHIETNASQFSFVEIKRRLKNAMGKEPQTPGRNERKMGKTVFDSGWSSPNRDHFYTERFARVTNGLKKNGDMSHQISNIYVEAKKHLSEMLTSGDEDAESMMRSLPKSLGRLLSIRDYNYSPSPGTSPRAQTRPLSREDSRMVNKSQPSANNDDPEEKVGDPDVMSSQGVREIVKSPSHGKEQAKVLDLSDEHDGVNFSQSNQERSPESLKPDLQGENAVSGSQTSPTGPLLADKTEELEIPTSDGAGKPSPISVLEPLFSDDDISPARTVSRPVEAGVQPLCMRFEETVCPADDQQIRIRSSTDAEESAFEYVEAVLLSSDLNWSEFENRWLSSVEILDLSLFDEVEIFSSRPRHDQRLLFDSTNEALQEVCDRFVLESTLVKRAVWPVPKGMDLINEVWRRLESRLYEVYPRDLDKLLTNDLETSRTWLDVRPQCRGMVVEIEESIFQETIDDTLLSLFNACVNGQVLHNETDDTLCCS